LVKKLNLIPVIFELVKEVDKCIVHYEIAS